MATSYHIPRPFNPVPKPAPTVIVAQLVATEERLRQLGDEAEMLYDQLFCAIASGHKVQAHHVIDRMLTLGAEHRAVTAALDEVQAA